MKKLRSTYTAIFFGAAVLTGLNSCTKLTETPFSAISTEQFYRTESDAFAALTSSYGAMVDIYNTAGTCASDWSADQTYPRQAVGRNTLTLFTYDANYTTQKSFSRVFESPQQIWQSCYSGTEKANWVIQKVPGIEMNVATRDAIVGEAFFLRAFYHFMVVKNFGVAVIKTTPTNNLGVTLNATSPKAEVYAQIFKDLDTAVMKLPAHTANLPKGRTSKEIALALYAKAALYAENWALSLDKAKQVIASGKFSLMPNVLDTYSAPREDAARVENMWAYESESASPGRSHQILSLYGPKNSDGPAYGATTFGSIFAYQKFFDSFNPIDKRRQLLDTNYVTRNGTVIAQKDVTPITPKGVHVKKYMDANSVGANGTINIPILRYADVLLIAAEAEARATSPTTAAYGYINTVRTRAGLPNLTPGLSQTAFVNAVLQERSWELFAEGDRWYDLTRTNTFMQVIATAVNDVYPSRPVQPKHRYFPIPQDEINANNKIEQTPEWK